MVFNWFRRQTDDSSDSPSEKQQPETSPVTESQVEPEATSTSAATVPDSTADLLAFAKAAYKNIQEKQKSQEVEATPESVDAETPVQTTGVEEEATADKENLELLVANTTSVEVVENIPTPVMEAEVANQEEQEVTSATQEDVGIDIEPIEPVAVSEPTPTPTLSFLERAAAEREARQERLIANAIEVPEPEVVKPVAANTSSETAPEIAGLSFDEGFVWSAEVLAAQGRRPEDISIEEITWLKKLRQGLDKTRRSILNQLKAIVGQGPLNQAAVGEIEALLLQADVGVEATDYIISSLQKKLREEVTPPEEAIAYLKQILRDMLDAPLKTSHKASFAPDKDSLNIWLITGVNGAGKTTTIGKISHLAKQSGYRCLIGAADTFRAAAVEQVKVWGKRSGVEVISNPGKNTDPAAVVFDAIAAAQARNTELLLVDTAGRLQNKKNLMDELSKIRRIIDKKAPDAKIESLLVLDSTLGQNGLRQAEVFSQAAQLSGVVLTKLDGTAKGGVALAVVQQLGLPIRFIGAGEGIEDLRPFSSYEFVEALLSG
ncbi:signal recognition particle-docking protein FtsY [Trichormus variabilis ATCC 29413]|uniref:Signal recognition particle receptor FtsY n=3 Tax=Anabaena variabilis TaxID=264691 RepID=Q3MGI3_TRIV2|nr:MULTISPECIES: signal recognition particle-docking protein FtsY [Nostocaceae]ABA19903.1 signal recognition particle-docking protein FtsY [Trichormus variabilis ATCC 29413]MBC1255409.1 signal recognition particle-docking protein FtsY [Trichormus variabilis V5]MBC1266300.1 signal recognition particle-docking protein FtsY [Trichormus variabilis FSR]MBC1304424.1 signal recognition particle-docking protein FtsY [Trichormus variabilis N2B]MBC1312876.1 signal recognition particle-docking protein Ft